MTQVKTTSSENVIRVYTRRQYGVEGVLKGLVEFDPPIREDELRNRVLRWILDDTSQAHFVSFEPDEQGLVSYVEHNMPELRDRMGRRSSFRSRGDLMDYYDEHGGNYHLAEE